MRASESCRGAELVAATRAQETLAGAQSRAVGQVSKFRGALEIGVSVRIPVWAYACTAEAKMPSLKKTTIAMAAQVANAEDQVDAGTLSARDFSALMDTRTCVASLAAAGKGGGGGVT